MISRRQFMKVSIGTVNAATFVPHIAEWLPALTLLRQVRR
jgi:hypothetical protein